MQESISKKRYIYLGIILIVILTGSFLLVVGMDFFKTREKSLQYEVEAKDVNYFTNTMGHLAKPKAAGSYPGVVMIHEWWGLTNDIKLTAEKLAGEGYIVLAVDLYQGEIASTPNRARELVSSIDQDKALQNMHAAISYLKTEYNVQKTASLGWCFGGGQSLQLAVSDEKLDATVLYYGTLILDEARLKKIQWPVLGIFGDKDASIPVATVKNFSSLLDKLKITNEIYIYPGVGHAFANPTGPNYAPNETKDAWGKTITFLNKYLK